MEEAVGSSGFLRLAQEFEAEFARLALHERIRELVPDTDYEPDYLHRRLLSLPWSDVFTTNWDTLLERACRDVFDRSYEVVRTVTEIPVASRPRIVKLHGSFPAHEPFIFTEDDYRTYPTKFASFVNLVQQSMMETVFCLVGFSGDDPNFLHWSGWVRDNLGASAPTVYLVGWLNLSKQRRRMLEDRRVLPIDLAELPQASGWPEHARHGYATEWFLAALEAGWSPTLPSWPSPLKARRPPAKYLEPVPAPTIRSPLKEPDGPHIPRHPLAERIVELQSARTIWAENREIYPGWLVLPSSARLRLWLQTRNWILELVELASQIEPVERLLALGELVWRLDTLLLPLFSKLEEIGSKTLDRIRCHQKTIENDDGSPGDIGKVSWHNLGDAWCRVALVLARSARNRGDRATWTKWLNLLTVFAEADADVGQQVAYERCLWSLVRLDYDALNTSLREWNPTKTDAAWAVRKAGILTEIERLEEAAPIFKAALTDVRRNRRRDVDDLRALSREGWSLWLVLAFTTFGGKTEEFVDSPEPFDRWRELFVHQCDAHTEYYSLLSELEKDENTGEVVKDPFELDRRIVSFNFSGGLSNRTLAAYQMLSLSEVTGLPHICNHLSILAVGIRKAVNITGDAERWSSSLRVIRLAQSASDEVIGEFFTRSGVALYSNDEIDNLKEVLVKQVDYTTPRCLGLGARYWSDRLGVALEVLSRITLRFPSDKAVEMLNAASRFYRSEAFIRNVFLHEPLAHLFQRSIETLSPSALRDALPDLFGLPIPQDSFIPVDLQHWPEPASALTRQLLSESSIEMVRDPVWDSIVATLIRIVGEGKTEARPRALLRLYIARRLRLLTQSNDAQLAYALWRPEYLDSDGFPTNHGLQDWVLMTLPESRSGQAEEAFRRKYLLDKGASQSVSLNQRLWMVGEAITHANELNVGLSPSEADRSLLAQMIREWSDEQPDERKDPFRALRQQGAAAQYEVLEGIATILLFQDIPGETAETVWRKIANMEDADGDEFAGYIMFPALARIYPDRIELLTSRLLRGLLSEHQQKAARSALGLYRWINAAETESLGVRPPATELVREVGFAIAARRRSILAQALQLATYVFTEGLSDYWEQLVDSCEHGLQCLLVEASYARSSEGLQKFEIPVIRRNCIRLAVAMTKVGFADKPGVKGWLAIAETDPLPEVRNAVSQPVLEMDPSAVSKSEG